MWIIETYRHTGERYACGIMKSEAIEEEIGDDLETALEIFTLRYPWEQYQHITLWKDGEKAFHACSREVMNDLTARLSKKAA